MSVFILKVGRLNTRAQRLAENAVENPGIDNGNVCDLRLFLLNTHLICLINRSGNQTLQSQQYDSVRQMDKRKFPLSLDGIGSMEAQTGTMLSSFMASNRPEVFSTCEKNMQRKQQKIQSKILASTRSTKR